MHLFLTGATGSVGLEVLRALRDDARFERVSCLLRGSARESAAQRWQSMLVAHDLLKPAGAPGPVMEFVDGELTAADFALSPETLGALASSVTHILHSAAHIRFDAQYDEAHAINVGGTQRVIEFASRCLRLLR